MNIKELEALVEGLAPVLEASIRKAVEPLQARIAELEKQLAEKPDLNPAIEAAVSKAVAAIPPATNGVDCDMNKVREWITEAVKALPAAKDGIGVAGAMIDRDGVLQLTLSSGEVKNLGVVEGRDGASFESFDMRYLDETSELEVKATAGGVTKEVRFHIGGMRGKGYWREGVTAKANEAWSYGGQLWIAVNETKAEPKAGCADWFLGARKGKDADTIIRTAPSNAPIRLGA